MTEIFQSQPHLLPSSSSSSCSTTITTTTFLSPIHIHQHHTHDRFPNLCPVALYLRGIQQHEDEDEDEDEEQEVCIGLRKKREREEVDQLSLFADLVTGFFRKSFVSCKKEGRVQGQVESSGMDISWPMNVRHVAHVTFDRFNGFLGLPAEFEPEVSRRPPSASTRVFGVSTESMQLSFDTRGNSVPTILLMMQSRLYAQNGLQAEGIFRINGENDEEEFVREQLNKGVVPDNVDVHCLAGLIKAWFRELPTGVLDSIPPEQVTQAQSEEECLYLTRLLPPTEAALLDWALNLMADVAQLEQSNKMNPRNIAMVFAPNMTKMADPLTALMFVVKVMNFLKTLIERILKDRQDFVVEDDLASSHPLEPSDQSGDHGALQPIAREQEVENEDQVYVAKEDVRSTTSSCSNQEELESYYEAHDILVDESENIHVACNNHVYTVSEERENQSVESKCRKNEKEQSSNSGAMKLSRKNVEKPVIHDIYVAENTEKGQDSNIISRVNWRIQRLEAWR